MHENREISNAPSLVDEGRSAKASGRTADMHALEKSDCAVVPVNQPNKAAIAAAEAGEGRAQMKENIGQPRMLPTQSGNRMSQGWTVCEKQQGKRNRERFTSLLHDVNTALLRDSFYALKRRLPLSCARHPPIGRTRSGDIRWRAAAMSLSFVMPTIL
jgi:hypothetical protein